MVRYLKVRKLPMKKKTLPKTEQPKLLMDIIEEEYPEKYETLKDKIAQLGRMFTQDEWLSILTKSRVEHERFLPKYPDRDRRE